MTINEMKLVSRIYTAYEEGTMQELVNEIHSKKHSMFYVASGWEYAGIDLICDNLIVQIDTATLGEMMEYGTGERLYYLPKEVVEVIFDCGRKIFESGEINRDRVMKIGE